MPEVPGLASLLVSAWADVAGVPGGPDADQIDNVEEVLLTAPVLRVEQEDVVAKR